MDREVPSKRKCPACGGGETKLLFRQQFLKIREAGLLDGYDVVACRTCGFCFAENLPSQQAFDIYYRELSKYEHQECSGQPSEFETRQFPLLARLVQPHLPNKDARILEIGCANGGLLNAVKQLGYPNVLGVDPSPVCARNAERLYQIRVLTGAMSDLTSDLGRFDLIILVAVLEHIRDLDGALTTLDGLLADGGALYLEVPDATGFPASPDAPFQEFSVEHVNFFTPASLANLMAAHRFTNILSERALYDQTDTHIAHAVRMIFRKTADVIGITADPTGELALMQYIASSQETGNRIHQIMGELVATGAPLIVWGVGTHTQRLLATSALADANIIAFVDSNPNYQGKTLRDKPILAPTDLAHMAEPILVSSRVFQSEIVTQIRSVLGLENRIYTLYEA